MRPLLLTLTFIAGALGLAGTALWALVGAGIYGSPFGGMSTTEAAAIVLLFLLGPLSLIPAGFIARKYPFRAGLFLVGSAVFTCTWHLGIIMNDGFAQLIRPKPAFEAWLPVLLLSGVPLLLGCGFLWLSRSSFSELLESMKTPAARHRLRLLAAGAGLVSLILSVLWILTAPVWEIDVVPAGKPAATLRIDPGIIVKRQAELDRHLGPLFSVEPGPAGIMELGSVVLKRKDVRGGDTTSQTMSLATFRTPEGFLIVCLDQTPIHYWFEVRGPVSPGDLKDIERGALRNAHQHLMTLITGLALTRPVK